MSTPPPSAQQPDQPQYPPAQPDRLPAGTPYPQQSSYGQPGGPTARPASNSLGVIAVILGGIPLLFSLIQPVITVLLLRAATNFRISAYDSVGALSAVVSGLAFVLGAAAVVVGIIGLRRRGASKALAGVGVGLGIAAVWGGIAGFLYPLVMSLANAQFSY